MKWLLASIAVAVLLTVGWFFHGSMTNPPVAPPVTVAPTPTSPITPPVTPPVTPVPAPTPPAPTLPVVPPNFIVPDELWQNAFRINLANGTPLRGTVGFSRLPIGTELRAPLDGYVSEGSATFPSGERILSLAWTVHERRPGNMGETKIEFDVSGAEIVNRSPRKGEVFARITGNTPIGVGFYDREAVFVIIVYLTDFGLQTDRTITDPKAYLWTAIQQLLPIK